MIHRLDMLASTRNCSVESGKEGAVKTFVGLLMLVGTGLAMVLSGSGPIDAAAEQSVVAQKGQAEDTQFPVYAPPKKLTPRARVGGTLRGTDGTDPEIVPLVPDHVAFTVKKTPTLNWYLSKPTTYPIHFTINNIQQVRPIYEGVLPPPKQEGVQSIDLKALGITLEPNVQYRWFVSATRNSDSFSEDIVGGGMIERCEIMECLGPMGAVLTCDESSVRRNVVSGLWYDAMACLCTLIDAKPADPTLRRLRADLLRQVGLHGVADWDLRSIQSALR
jgi:Domain of Unknown Function (DUF928)